MLSTLSPPAPAAWRAEANCQEADVELFFAPDEASQHEALALCSACPVREACLDHALTHREPFGIWGGTREHERRRLVRQQRRVA